MRDPRFIPIPGSLNFRDFEAIKQNQDSTLKTANCFAAAC